MRLHEHPDFDQAVLRAEEHFRDRRLRAPVIQKDYYVTEALRMIAAAFGQKVIFKGGTSLSKGWNLIQRFSEDIDLFLDPLAFEPALGKKAVDRELKRLRDAVARHPAMTFVREESQTIGGSGRSDRFAYDQRFGGAGEMRNRVLVEAGTASGREPTADVSLRSYLGEFLQDTGQTLGTEDEDPFPFRLLHSAAPSSRSCSPSTARSSCSSATAGRSGPTPGTTTTCTSSPGRRRSWPCWSRTSTTPSRTTTTGSAAGTSRATTRRLPA